MGVVEQVFERQVYQHSSFWFWDRHVTLRITQSYHHDMKTVQIDLIEREFERRLCHTC